MRILFVNPFYKPYLGGIERVIEALAREFLRRQEVEAVGLLTTFWSFPRSFHPQWPAEDEDQGLRIWRVRSFPAFAPPFYQVPLVYFYLSDFQRILRSFKPDIIQLMNDRWFFANWALQFLAPPQSKIYLSPSFHDLSWKNQWLRLLNFFLYRRLDGIQAITNLEAEKLVRNYGVAREKIRVIPWGYSHWKAAAQAGKKKKSTTINLLAVGRLSEHKGQAWLLDLFAEVEALVDQPLRLILVGADEGAGKNLTAFCRTHHLEEKVVLAGAVSDEELARYYQEADIFLLFPAYEAFGLVFLEAMSYGLPVLSHRVGALAEVLQDKALLVDPYNRAQAKVILTRLINDSSWRTQVGKAGQEFVAKNYSWSNSAEKFLQWYQGGQNGG